MRFSLCQEEAGLSTCLVRKESGRFLVATATGVSSSEATVSYPWLRFSILFTISGSAGDKVSVVFDLQANLMRK